jgi:hypothetical protein
LQTLCQHAYTCLTPIINALSRWFFSKFFEVPRITLRSFLMQLSKKTAMLFFIYLNAVFTSQTEISDGTNTSGEPISRSGKMTLSINPGEISLTRSFFSYGNVTRIPESDGDRLICANTRRDKIISDLVLVLSNGSAEHRSNDVIGPTACERHARHRAPDDNEARADSPAC